MCVRNSEEVGLERDQRSHGAGLCRATEAIVGTLAFTLRQDPWESFMQTSDMIWLVFLKNYCCN